MGHIRPIQTIRSLFLWIYFIFILLKSQDSHFSASRAIDKRSHQNYVLMKSWETKHTKRHNHYIKNCVQFQKFTIYYLLVFQLKKQCIFQVNTSEFVLHVPI